VPVPVLPVSHFSRVPTPQRVLAARSTCSAALRRARAPHPGVRRVARRVMQIEHGMIRTHSDTGFRITCASPRILTRPVPLARATFPPRPPSLPRAQHDHEQPPLRPPTTRCTCGTAPCDHTRADCENAAATGEGWKMGLRLPFCPWPWHFRSSPPFSPQPRPKEGSHPCSHLT